VNATIGLERDRRHRLRRWTLAAVASSPQMTGAPGRCLLHIPFGISAVRESQVRPPHRSEQPSRMSRNRQEQRPGGGAGRI